MEEKYLLIAKKTIYFLIDCWVECEIKWYLGIL